MCCVRKSEYIKEFIKCGMDFISSISNDKRFTYFTHFKVFRSWSGKYSNIKCLDHTVFHPWLRNLIFSKRYKDTNTGTTLRRQFKSCPTVFSGKLVSSTEYDQVDMKTREGV